MSNYLAIAATTYAVGQHLQRAVSLDVAGATATMVRPDGSDGQLAAPGVNLYLYQAIPNAALANFDLPTRDSRGGGTRRPTVAYDLMYLLTFHGSEATLEPQRVLGSVLRHIHGQPCLSQVAVRTILQAGINADPNFFLRNSDLANQFDSLKITPLKLSLEDLSKIWSVFFQTNYVLSAAISVTAVWLEADEPAREQFPVLHPQVFVMPFADIAVERVEPVTVTFVAGAPVTVHGRGLVGAGREIRVGQLPAVVQPGSTATTAVIELPAGVGAGPQAVTIWDQNPLGANHTGYRSNSIPVLVRPVVNNIAFLPDASARHDHSIRVNAAPVIGLDQTVNLVLNRMGAGEPAGFSLSLRPRALAADPLVFDARWLTPGNYIYRLRVDGVDSPVTLNLADPNPLNQPVNGPVVNIP